MPEIFPEVLQAVPGENYIVYAYFNDGTVRRYDASELWVRAFLRGYVIGRFLQIP